MYLTDMHTLHTTRQATCMKMYRNVNDVSAPALAENEWRLHRGMNSEQGVGGERELTRNTVLKRVFKSRASLNSVVLDHRVRGKTNEGPNSIGSFKTLLKILSLSLKMQVFHSEFSAMENKNHTSRFAKMHRFNLEMPH